MAVQKGKEQEKERRKEITLTRLQKSYLTQVDSTHIFSAHIWLRTDTFIFGAVVVSYHDIFLKSA